jgi:hypothetical protein
VALSLSNSAEGGSNGTGVTTGNSGGGSGDAWTSVSLGASTSATYDSTNPMHGSLAYSLAQSTNTGSGALLRWNVSGVSSNFLRVRFYLNTAAFFSAAGIMCWVTDPTNATPIARIGMNTSGKFLVQQATASTLFTGTTTIPTSTWIRVEMIVIAGTTTTNGTIKFAWYLGDSATAQETFTNAATNTGTGGGFNTLSFGKPTGTWNTTTYWDDFAADDGSNSAFIGPVPSTWSSSLTAAGTGGMSLSVTHTVNPSLAPKGTGTAAITPAVTEVAALAPVGTGSMFTDGSEFDTIAPTLAMAGTGSATFPGGQSSALVAGALAALAITPLVTEPVALLISTAAGLSLSGFDTDSVTLSMSGVGTAATAGPTTFNDVFSAFAFGQALVSSVLQTARVLTGVGDVTAGGTVNARSVVVPVPPNTIDGDVLLTCVFARQATVAPTAPAGWTLLATCSDTAVGWMGVYAHAVTSAASEPPQYGWTWASSVPLTRVDGLMFRTFGLVLTPSPVDAVGTGAEATGTTTATPSLALPSVTTTAAGDLVLALLDNSTSSNTPRSYTPPSGWSMVGQATSGPDANGSVSTMQVAQRTPVSQGATGVVTFTGTGSFNSPGNGVGFLLALKAVPVTQPPPTNSPPVVDAGAVQQNVEPYATVLLSASEFDIDGTIVTRLWQQTAGDAVSLTGAGTLQATFTAPATIAGETLGFTYTATDNNGAATTDTTSVQVLGVTERAVIGGVEVPMQIREF